MLLEGILNSLPDLPSDGLEVVAEAIDGVIRQIDAEQRRIRPAEFRNDGSIAQPSLGGADAAPLLALHHSRAHEVVGNTLDAIKADLAAFQEACIAAKNMIVVADEESADRMRSAEAVVEALAAGSSGRESRNAHQQAQQEQDVTGGVDL